MADIWKELVPIGLGAVGTVLGVMNTWNTMSQRQMRMRVTPAFLLEQDGTPFGFSIEAVNLSAFPLTLCEIGFRTAKKRRTVITGYRTSDGRSLPCRLEPREAISFMFGAGDVRPPSGHRIGAAYIRTACGRTILGDSPARKQFSNMMA
ncbi:MULTISPECIES: hypothetical protein [Rhizobium]|uniref:Uncharacterized protein n=1 Tax=Rhizobium aouanii TaxID=3118145 RepID=A0ABU8CKU8_9HYPH|nr:hypothetical protein [Rhizobium acaciae]MCW1410747.1 hypothetical protein [Rhizobium acaciae]MCW1742954.1 hypothetical protein [Rhizobium acaciae]MCW1750150.1 hypothetical protein [Rhizobium acaciae]